MVQLGVKRKLEDVDLEENCHGHQRQSILDISMCKLKTTPVRRVEPSLLRSVLILNTLKHIENELRGDGVGLSSSGDPNFISIPEITSSSLACDMLHEVETMDGAEQSSIPYSSCDIPVSSVQDNSLCRLPPIETLVDISTATSSLKIESPPVIIQRCHSDEAHLNYAKKSSENTLTPMVPVSSASLTKFEDMFGEFDLTMSDYDIISSISSSLKLTPLSAEEVIHSFPLATGMLADSYSYLNTQTLSPYCKGDPLIEDLENIMQILVGT